MMVVEHIGDNKDGSNVVQYGATQVWCSVMVHHGDDGHVDIVAARCIATTC